MNCLVWMLSLVMLCNDERVGAGPVAAGITILVWWFRYHFRIGNVFMRRINDLGWLQHINARKIRVVPETAHRTLGGQSVS